MLKNKNTNNAQNLSNYAKPGQYFLAPYVVRMDFERKINVPPGYRSCILIPTNLYSDVLQTLYTTSYRYFDEEFRWVDYNDFIKTHHSNIVNLSERSLSSPQDIKISEFFNDRKSRFERIIELLKNREANDFTLEDGPFPQAVDQKNKKIKFSLTYTIIDFRGRIFDIDGDCNFHNCNNYLISKKIQQLHLEYIDDKLTEHDRIEIKKKIEEQQIEYNKLS